MGEHKDKHSRFSETFSKVHAPVALSDIKWAQNWLAQHIRNTDFGYKGHLKHHVPEPYVWDTTFAVDYNRLDEEHNVLFANILAVSQDPSDAGKLQELVDNMKKHFDYEEQRFCAVPNYNCVDHKMKHYKFFVVLEDQKALWAARKSTGPRTGWLSTSRTLTTSTGRGSEDLTPEISSLGPFHEETFCNHLICEIGHL